MTIIAVYQNQKVEVLDTYQAGGVNMASVKAIEGTPFVGGDKWAVKTEWATCPAADLADVRSDHPQPARSTLLTQALAYQDKRQWSACESVWLWGVPGRRGAYLKEQEGFVHLCLVGKRQSCPIYYLNQNGWQTCATVQTNYRHWAEAVR